MTFWIYLIGFFMPSLVENLTDPVDGWVATNDDLRAMDCEALPVAGAQRETPARLDLPEVRADYLNRRAMICRGRLLPPGVRASRDDAVLMDLRATAQRAAAAAPEPLRRRTWWVEVFYPHVEVSQKLSFATKNALLDRGFTVTDRVPSLAAADLQIIGVTPPARAYPLACARYAAGGSLRAGQDALLALVLRHPRATTLHPATCVDGQWRWLR